MRRKVLAIGLAYVLGMAGSSVAQDKPLKIAIINIQMSIAQSSDGQEAAKGLQARFAPKRAELEKQQKEINDLQTQLRNQEKTLSDEARSRLLRTVDDKTRVFNRTNEDATAEFQQAEQDAINEIGRKMMAVISDHAQKNGFSVVLDVSSPQTPVLYAETEIDITKTIVDLYEKILPHRTDNQACGQFRAEAGRRACSEAAGESSGCESVEGQAALLILRVHPGSVPCHLLSVPGGLPLL